MPTAIKVENVSKQYRLGKVGTGTLGHDLNRWWHRIRGKEDPYLKIGDTNDRTIKGFSDYVWALRDINFEVSQGEALGIIGRNGAGKSTLLKILSRTTAPTTGRLKMKGRVASLLEVGTGFHPELSGRDNIYLNGAILGMTRKEITKKFDEIVDFSGVERYIDTPVKRYSSGMYVRLAFAVAAHLESEILIVDEVLAVGDAEFQKKCLGKMGEVSKGEGRTVLFVSHNMTAVRTLCSKGILLANGSVDFNGDILNCINYYGRETEKFITKKEFIDKENRPSTDNIDLLSYRLVNNEKEEIDSFNYYEDVYIEIEYLIKNNKSKIYPNIHFFTHDDNYIFVSSARSADLSEVVGYHKATIKIPKYTFNVGVIKIGIAFTRYPGTDVQFFINPAIITEVKEDNLSFRGYPYSGPIPGTTRIQLACDIQTN